MDHGSIICIILLAAISGAFIIADWMHNRQQEKEHQERLAAFVATLNLLGPDSETIQSWIAESKKLPGMENFMNAEIMKYRKNLA